MENKKLLKFLLKDLNELEELFAEKDNGHFEDLEMEFLHTRLKSSKKLVGILLERENQTLPKNNEESVDEPVEKIVIHHESS